MTFRIAVLCLFAFSSACEAPSSGEPPQSIAEKVFTNGKIYTANANRDFASAMAIADNEILFVGSDEEASAFIGPDTVQTDLNGGIVLPGLHDTHIHPVFAMDLPSCNLDSQPFDLSGLSDFIEACIARLEPGDGEWMPVRQWAFGVGNNPTDEFNTLREALDAAAPNNPVVLLGNDGHHFAVNSAAFNQAKNADGETVPITAATLETDYAEYKPHIQVDQNGEPSGPMSETGLPAVGGEQFYLGSDMSAALANPELLLDVVLPRGITSILDAATSESQVPVYELLDEKGMLNIRASLALWFDPSEYADDNGDVDYELMLQKANAIRERHKDNERIRPEFLKLFADGVLEGDPIVTPPTMPASPLLHGYQQPIFTRSDSEIRVAGYVDQDSAVCIETRAAIDAGAPPERDAFVAANGFHPEQCVPYSGFLQHPEDRILDYVKEGDAAGYTFLIHAINDKSVRTALDAIDGAHSANGSDRRHIITHLQLVHPDDQARFAESNTYASFTFAWAIFDPIYDMSVAPFIDRVDESFPDAPDNDSYYYSNVYPVQSIKGAGAEIIAGSDAPVDTANPRPFVNMAAAVTRSQPGQPKLNEPEALNIYEAVDTYTRTAAQALNLDDITGVLEPGKRADFIIIDQDIFDLAENGNPYEIANTEVQQTWFDGELVFKR